MKTLRTLVAGVLSIKPEDLKDSSSPENIASWDSFNGLMLVSELESNFGVKFSMDEVMEVKSYSDIKKALKKHGVNQGVDD